MGCECIFFIRCRLRLNGGHIDAVCEAYIFPGLGLVSDEDVGIPKLCTSAEKNKGG